MYPRVEEIKAVLKENDLLVNDTKGRKRDGCFRIFKTIEICDLQKALCIYATVKTESERKQILNLYEKYGAIELHETGGDSKKYCCWGKFEHTDKDFELIVALVKDIVSVLGLSE